MIQTVFENKDCRGAHSKTGVRESRWKAEIKVYWKLLQTWTSLVAVGMKRELDAKLAKLINLLIGLRGELSSDFSRGCYYLRGSSVPGSFLPSCCNMTVIYMITVFTYKWHLMKGSVSVL